MHRHSCFPLSCGRVFLLPCLLFLSWSCEKQSPDIIDSKGLAPRILSASLNPSSVDSDTINIGPERKPTDLLSYEIVVSAKIDHPEGEANLSETTVTFFRTKREPAILAGSLHNDGFFPDLSAQDSVFTGLLKFSAMRSDIGSFFAEVTALDKNGFSSNTLRLTFSILRLNQPPMLSNLVAPDTVSRSTEDSFVITVVATDPDGPSDILSVTRTTPSNLVLYLNDSGINGDITAGDNIFTETVSLSPTQPLGTYPFSFKATDRSNASSSIIVKSIVVAP